MAMLTFPITSLWSWLGWDAADVLSVRHLVVLVPMLLCLAACRGPEMSADYPEPVQVVMEAADEALDKCLSWSEQNSLGQASESLRRFDCENEPTSMRSSLGIATYASEEKAANWVAFSQMLSMCQRLMTPADLETLDVDELLLGDLTIRGQESDLITLQDVIGGAVFTRRDPFPPGAALIDGPDAGVCGGVEIQPGDWGNYRSDVGPLGAANAAETEESLPTPATPASPSQAPSELAPGAVATGDECVEDCTWGVHDVIDDLSQVLCASRDEWATLSDDLTGDPPLSIGADVVLACTAGGSASYLGFGIAFAWEDYAGLQAAMPELDDCATSGLTFVGGDPTHPGYAIITHDGDPSTVTALLEGAAQQICP